MQKDKKSRIVVHGVDGAIIAAELLMADNYWLRLRGLIGRPPLKPQQAIWIKPCQQVHTHFMSYALDVVFLDRQLRVVEIVRGLEPWKLSPWVRSAHSLLEFPAGGAAHLNIGDPLQFSA